MSIAALNLAGGLAYLPHCLRLGAQVKEDQSYDNVNPRASLERHLNKKGLISRLQAAHDNSLESFQLFAAGILASSSIMKSPGDRAVVLEVASLHLLARLAFIGLYACSTEKNAWLGHARSIAWAVGTMCSSFLLLKAGARFVTVHG